MSRRGRFGSYTVEVDLYEILESWSADDREELFREFSDSYRINGVTDETTWVESIETLCSSATSVHIIKNKLTKRQKDMLRELLE